jgi:lipopolysaccharide/colanic/teichoic acid biosynthesis glycosyltransferase
MRQLLRNLSSFRIYLLTFIECALVIGCHLAVVFLYEPVEASIYLLYDNGIRHISTVGLLFLLISYLFDSYKHIRSNSRFVVVLQVTFLMGILLIGQAVLVFVSTDLLPPHPMLLMSIAGTFVMLVIWRVFLRPAVWNAIGAHRILFVGTGEAVHRLTVAITEQPSLGMDIRGYVVAPDSATDFRPVVGVYRDLTKIVSQVKPDRIIVSDKVKDNGILKVLFDIRAAGLVVESAADAYEAVFGRVYSPAIDPYNVILRNEFSASPGSIALQSIYNNLLAITFVVLMLPVIVIVALALKLTRRGPILTKHVCLGLHGQPFRMYRFKCDSPDRLSTMLFKYKIDGILQVVNIFRGEMSLIGPRAELAEFSHLLEDLIPFYRQRYSVKPGVIGWSQLHCDPEDVEDTLTRVEYDLYYLKHISLLLDAYIVLRGLKWILSERKTTAAEEAGLSVGR